MAGQATGQDRGQQYCHAFSLLVASVDFDQHACRTDETGLDVTQNTPSPFIALDGSGGGGAPVPTPAVEITLAGRTVRLHVAEVGLACCAVEQQAATELLASLSRVAQSPTGSAPLAAADTSDAASSSEVATGLAGAEAIGVTGVIDVLVVSGTVTDAMAPSIVRLFERLPEPRAAVAFGACASTGGPYWDSPLVTNGIDQLLPVNAYIPGCPPRPEAFLSGMSALVSGLSAGLTAGAPSGGDLR